MHDFEGNETLGDYCQFPMTLFVRFLSIYIFMKSSVLNCTVCSQRKPVYVTLCFACNTYKIKLEGVILRLKMIQCNPTCDDSTGSV